MHDNRIASRSQETAQDGEQIYGRRLTRVVDSDDPLYARATLNLDRGSGATSIFLKTLQRIANKTSYQHSKQASMKQRGALKVRGLCCFALPCGGCCSCQLGAGRREERREPVNA